MSHPAAPRRARAALTLLVLAAALADCADAPTADHKVAADLTYDDGFTLYEVDSAGASHAVAHSDQSLFDASWSPDGKQAVFTREVCNPTCAFSLRILDPSTGAERALVGGGGMDYTDAAWSPAGDLIAFQTRPRVLVNGDGSVELHVIHADGTGERRLGTDRYYVRNPSWSPDGTRLAATSADVGVVIVDAATGARVGSLGAGYAPSWSPDGRRLAFTDGSTLFVADVDGTNRRTLSPNGYEPAWSPDGTLIAYTYVSDGLRVIAPDGTGDRAIALHAPGAARAAWRRR
jgi:TolB protein